MKYPLDEFREEIENSLTTVLGDMGINLEEIKLETPPSLDIGDLAFA